MKIGAKLGVAFALITAILIIVIYMGINASSNLNNSVQELAKDKFPKTVWANGIIDAVNEGARALRNAILTDDPKDRDTQIERTKATTPKVAMYLDSLTNTVKSEQGIKILNEMKEARNIFVKERETLIKLIMENKKKEATDLLFTSFRKVQTAYLEKINEMIKYQSELFDKSALEAEETYNAQFNLLIILGLVAVLLAIILAVIVTRGITKPLSTGVNIAEEIARGNTNVNIEVKGKDETAMLLTAMKGMAGTIKEIINEINNSVKMAKDGKLDYRANSAKYQGDFKELVLGFNSTLDAVIGPLNVAAEYVDRISKGDIPPKITDEYKGDFNEIKNNLNTCIDAVNLLVSDANMLVRAAVDGRLDTRADASRHQGDFRKIVQGVNDTLNAVIGPLNVAAEYIDRISKGDIPPKITDEYKGDFNEIKNNLNLLIDADQRISNILLEVSKGNLNVTINERSSQDILIKSLKTTIKSIQELIDDTEIIANAAEEGKLEVRADIDKHEGAYKELIKSFNNTLNSVITPIKEAGQVLGIMAMGDLTVRMLGDYKGDLSKLKDDINSLADSLNGLIQQVNELVNNTASSAAEISATAESIATASQEQSSQADEVASAVEEMTRTITENALAANKTAEVAKVSGKIATEGGSVVSQTVNKMRDIANVVKNSADNIQKLGESSKQIGEIISVIDDIADQTNLLALNAAIEAARAGEQGRGFAVVADEVRKLAERTTEATKQIAVMIKGIQSETEAAVLAMNKGTIEVTSGIELADKAGQSLQQILNSTQEVIDMINQIAAASEEQSATSEQISKNVTSISQVTAESAKRVEDVAHTAEDLAKMTNQLADLMRQFKIDEYSSNMPMRQLSRNRAKQLGSKLG